MSRTVDLETPLAVGGRGRNTTAWWGLLCLIATEGSLFAYLLFSYFYVAVQRPADWAPQHPSVKLALPNTAVLLLSSLAVWWGERGAKAGRRGQLTAGLAAAATLGLLFAVVQVFEWRGKRESLSSGSHGSLYFTVTGFHMAHVAVGVAMLGAVLWWSLRDRFTARRHTPVTITAAYWHFVDAVWLAVFTTFYVTPYFMW